MDKRKIQELIPIAMDAIESVGIVDTTTASFEKVHEGYINALGPNIVQSGLLPTLIFYNKEERELWLKALYYMEMKQEGKEMTDPDFTAIIKLVIDEKAGDLKILATDPGHKKWEKKILEYAVALKLALRTFTAKETSKEEKGGKGQ
ncbi:MAG: type III-B CRISPR module-associated protein Cmr5 [Porphyromonas sp.]|nr:type III-B CRISPR module-associated protein Cmr5 [Porphyromonas sp.]